MACARSSHAASEPPGLPITAHGSTCLTVQHDSCIPPRCCSRSVRCCRFASGCLSFINYHMFTGCSLKRIVRLSRLDCHATHRLRSLRAVRRELPSHSVPRMTSSPWPHHSSPPPSSPPQLSTIGFVSLLSFTVCHAGDGSVDHCGADRRVPFLLSPIWPQAYWRARKTITQTVCRAGDKSQWWMQLRQRPTAVAPHEEKRLRVGWHPESLGSHCSAGYQAATWAGKYCTVASGMTATLALSP